jgi:adenine C2-methylase RlmN of 23S rRNA A2503 and tRNA A37
VTLHKPLREIFRFITPTIYYSLYSVSEEFRRQWMPAAMPVHEALAALKAYQDFSKKIVKIHFPFIAGVNDSALDVDAMCEAIETAGLRVEFNLVRYNPASPSQGVESAPEVLEARLDQIRQRLEGKVQAIPRVGFDVKASCGMFITPEVQT